MVALKVSGIHSTGYMDHRVCMMSIAHIILLLTSWNMLGTTLFANSTTVEKKVAQVPIFEVRIYNERVYYYGLIFC